MSITVFDEQYLTNVKEIDEHHAKLISLLNDLLEGTKAGQGRELAPQALQELFQYAQYHFRIEEDYLRRIKDKNIGEHRIAHGYFIEQLEGLKHSVEAKDMMAAAKVVRFLANWLLSHILETDKVALGRAPF